MQIFVKSLGGSLVSLECSDHVGRPTLDAHSKIYQEFMSKAYPSSTPQYHTATYLRLTGLSSRAPACYEETARLLGGASGTANQFNHPTASASAGREAAGSSEPTQQNPGPPSSFASLAVPNDGISGGSSGGFHQPVFFSPATFALPSSTTAAAAAVSSFNQPFFVPASQPISIPVASSSKFLPANEATTMFGTFAATMDPGFSASASSSLSNSLGHSLGSTVHRKTGGPKHKCTLDGCTDRAAKIIGDCRYCDGHYCSVHRLPEAHSCSNIQSCRQESFDKNSVKLMGEKCVADKV